MLRGQPVTAVIPVRGGSKGIPGKNLYRLGRDTLLERTIKIAKLCSHIDQVVVSTDDPEMYNIATLYSVATPTLRPLSLAQDNSKTVDVILNLLDSRIIRPGWILLLQVTSPLRTLADLNDFCNFFSNASAEVAAAVSLVKFDSPHPNKIQKIENGFVKSYLGVESMIPRQKMPEVYALNGAFYITDDVTLLEKRTFLPENTIPFLMPEKKSLNLDTVTDLVTLEALLKSGICSVEEYDLDF